MHNVIIISIQTCGGSLLEGPPPCLIIFSSFRTAQILWCEMHGGRDRGSLRRASDSLKTYEFAYKRYGGSLLEGPRSCFIICSSFRTAQFLWREMHGGPQQRQPPPGLRQSHMNCYTKFENIFTLTRYCLSQTVTSSW